MRKSPTLVGNKWSLIYIHYRKYVELLVGILCIIMEAYGIIESCYWFESHDIHCISLYNLKCLFILEETPLLKLPDRFQYKMKGFSLKVGSILLDVTSLCASYKASEICLLPTRCCHKRVDQSIVRDHLSTDSLGPKISTSCCTYHMLPGRQIHSDHSEFS